MKQLFKIVSFCIALLTCNFAMAQNYEQISRRIDSLDKIRLPKSALIEANRLYQLARKNNNAAQQIKASIYRIRFQSTGTDEPYVVVTDTLKHSIAQSTYPVKPVLQSLLAQVYGNYYRDNRYRFTQRTHIEKPDPDFTKWDIQTINSEIQRLFILSLKDYKKEQETPTAQFDAVLVGDKTTRYLRSTLYDILVQNALTFFLSEEPALTKPKMPFSLDDPRLFSDGRTFAALIIKTTDTNSTYYRGIKYLQQATLFHLKKPNDEALADIDLQRLEFLNRQSNVVNKEGLYVGALKKIATQFSAKPISSDAYLLLGKYYQGTDSLKLALEYLHKAVSSFPQSLGAKNAEGYIKLIQHKDLTAEVEDQNIPGKPLLGLLRYHNLTAARTIIYKLSTTQFNQLIKIPSQLNRVGNGPVIYPSDSVYHYLHGLTPVQDKVWQLPVSADYKSHTAEFKIDPLSPGMYVMVVRDNQSNDSTLMQLTSFKVSRLAYVTRHITYNQIEVRVMDRETGAPVPGVKVALNGINENITDSNGSCMVILNVNNSFSVRLSTRTDTLYEPSRYSYYRGGSTNTNPTTMFFTDRQLYRPGQVVYYKGLQLLTQNGKSTILPGVDLNVTVKDNNNRSLDSKPVQTNEFGTFSGSFNIPQSILNGYITISTPNGNVLVRVEEYKRPSFQVEFLPIKESYRPNDSVTIKGHVTAYSGYGLSMARVVYHVNHLAIAKDYRNQSKYQRALSRQNVVITDTIKTDGQGNFKIKFKATAVAGITADVFNYLYMVSADITDASGETRAANTNFSVSMNNIAISAPFLQKIFPRDSIIAGITNLSQVPQSGALHMEIYALAAPPALFKNKYWTKPDQYLLNKAEYKKDFPDYDYSNETDQSIWAVKGKVADVSLNTNGTQPAIFKLNTLSNQPTGTYKIVLHAKNSRGDTTSLTRYADLVNEPGTPQKLLDWITPLVTQPGKDSTVSYLVGLDKPVNVLIEKHNATQILSSKWVNIAGDKQQVIKIPISVNEKNITVSFLMVYQNRQYTSLQSVIDKADDNLDIKFLTFRDKLEPGEKEQWKVQVSGKNNERQAVEMVANMYDASLDALGGRSNWNNLSNINNRNISTQFFAWDGGTGNGVTTLPLKFANYNSLSQNPRSYETFNIKRINSVGSNAEITIDEPVGNSDVNKVFDSVNIGYGLQGKVAGLNEVTIQLRGNSSIGAYPVQAKQDIHGDILEGIQGDQPASIPRTNFNETAFFYPQLHTDENGQILINFTVPESLTKWRFRAIAHTKNLTTGYVEKEIVTQKQLSINTNMPRFLREGDTLIVSARLANLTASALKGKVNLQLFNAINMQPVSLLINNAEAKQDFDIVATSTKAVSFKLIIPAGLDALTYRITAATDKYSDGEENTLPVLPNRMLVTESLPMMVRAGQTKAFAFDKLINQQSKTLASKSLTLEYTQNPAWYAVQALPYMMEFPYECSEQIFSRYYANSLATNLVNKMPAIKQVFDQWKASNSPELLSNLEKNQELKATLIEETPWLRDAETETEQKKRVALLFDLNKMTYELQANLTKLRAKQLPNGGFPWFGGDRADAYITRYILAGMGQLYKSGAVDLKNAIFKIIADRGMSYLDNTITDEANREKERKQYDQRILSSTEIHSWYSESYYINRKRNEAIQDLSTDYLERASEQWQSKSVYEQGMMALTLLRNKRPAVAQLIINSLKETAQQNEDMGMYWAKNQPGYFWYQAPIETQSLMIELFTEAGDQQKAVEEMKIWLLRNKQTNDWKTTTATAQACYALLMKGDNLLNDAGTSTIKLDGKLLTDIKPDIKADAGSGYIKTSWVDEQIKPALGKVEIANNGKTISWGALHWQYTEKLDKITSSNTHIHLERKYFIEKQGAIGPVLTAVDAKHTPKTGDILKVVVYLKSTRDFEYVQLKDMRPAGTEPIDVLSNYKYQDGLYYYQVTKDVATDFFISQLSKGNYVFEYRLRVVQPGNYSTGISSIQSMYAPEFNAHSEGMRLTIGK